LIPTEEEAMTKKRQKTEKTGAVDLSESELGKAEGGAMQIFVKTLTSRDMPSTPPSTDTAGGSDG
jgi:hypothetical protein